MRRLELSPGEFVVLIGASGCRQDDAAARARAASSRPRPARVRVGDVVLTEAPEREVDRVRRDDIGYVFQSFGLIGALSAEENVELPMRIRGADASSERAARVSELLERVGLADHAQAAARASSRAASSSASASPARSPDRRASCSPTSRPDSSTRRPRRR